MKVLKLFKIMTLCVSWVFISSTHTASYADLREYSLDSFIPTCLYVLRNNNIDDFESNLDAHYSYLSTCKCAQNFIENNDVDHIGIIRDITVMISDETVTYFPRWDDIDTQYQFDLLGDLRTECIN